VEHAGVDRGGEEVIGSRDGVDIAGQVEVEILHGDHLAVATTRSAALNPKGRTLAGLTNTGKDALAQISSQSLAETDSGGGLALTQRRGSDGGYIDVLPIGGIFEAVEDLQFHLGLVRAIELKLLGEDAQLIGNIQDGLEGSFLGDLDIRRDRGAPMEGSRCELLGPVRSYTRRHVRSSPFKTGNYKPSGRMS
jgi:hypothetical protein